MRCNDSVQCIVRPGICILLAFAVLILPLKWLAAWITAVIIHEAFHVLALFIFKYKIFAIHITLGGAVLETEPLKRWHELVCALAGPLGGLLLVLLAPWLPRVAICACVQTMYNLLPLYPLDGGRALRCIAGMLTSDQKSERIIHLIEIMTQIGIGVLGFIASFVWRLGPLPLVCVVVLIAKSKEIKIPCKAGLQRVQ